MTVGDERSLRRPLSTSRQLVAFISSAMAAERKERMVLKSSTTRFEVSVAFCFFPGLEFYVAEFPSGFVLAKPVV